MIKKIISFLSISKTQLLKFYRLSDATFYDRINTVYHFIKPFLDKKCLFMRNMEPLTIPNQISTISVWSTGVDCATGAGDV